MSKRFPVRRLVAGSAVVLSLLLPIITLAQSPNQVCRLTTYLEFPSENFATITVREKMSECHAVLIGEAGQTQSQQLMTAAHCAPSQILVQAAKDLEKADENVQRRWALRFVHGKWKTEVNCRGQLVATLLNNQFRTHPSYTNDKTWFIARLFKVPNPPPAPVDLAVASFERPIAIEPLSVDTRSHKDIALSASECLAFRAGDEKATVGFVPVGIAPQSGILLFAISESLKPGDSGAPLLCRMRGELKVAGINSFVSTVASGTFIQPFDDSILTWITRKGQKP